MTDSLQSQISDLQACINAMADLSTDRAFLSGLLSVLRSAIASIEQKLADVDRPVGDVEICEECSGTGHAENLPEACPRCEGSGILINERVDPLLWLLDDSPSTSQGEPCEVCKGTGVDDCEGDPDSWLSDMWNDLPCATCGGSGYQES